MAKGKNNLDGKIRKNATHVTYKNYQHEGVTTESVFFNFILLQKLLVNHLIPYRLKKLSKKKVSKKLKRLFSALLVIKSSEIRGKKYTAPLNNWTEEKERV